MKKILFSLSIIVAAAALVVGGTMAFFNDTETSTGNVFTAGSIDLKVDHTKQTYNGLDCKTCSVLLVSDPTNMVVAKNGVAVTPYPAVYLNPTHPAWTAQNDPALSAANAEWIWEQNPVKQEDTVVDTTYTFKKTFQWWGPIVSTDLSMAVGHDNTVEVWLNGVQIGVGTNIYGFQIENMLHIPAANITANVLQGENVLEIKLRNRAEPNGNPQNNPAGLIYKFEINGNCGDDYFKTNCQLWGPKDLVQGDHFWNIGDVKPGDYGTNVISLHASSNDAYSCLYVNNTLDNENDVVSPEIAAGDNALQFPSPYGELSNYLNVIVWADANGNGIHELAETVLYNGALATEMIQLSLTASQTQYVGLAWCAGTQTIDGAGVISCSGAGNQNDAQTDSFSADLTAYAIQQRHNENFSCSSIMRPTSAELACTNSGGTVGISTCCLAAGDFPGTCGIGACGCSQESSHEVKVCNCPAGTCFDGNSCVGQQNPN